MTLLRHGEKARRPSVHMLSFTSAVWEHPVPTESGWRLYLSARSFYISLRQQYLTCTCILE